MSEKQELAEAEQRDALRGLYLALRGCEGAGFEVFVSPYYSGGEELAAVLMRGTAVLFWIRKMYTRLDGLEMVR